MFISCPVVYTHTDARSVVLVVNFVVLMITSLDSIMHDILGSVYKNKLFYMHHLLKFADYFTTRWGKTPYKVV